MITRERNTVTLDLTVPLVIWTVIFVGLAVVRDDFGWLWWAVLPWLGGLGLMALGMLVMFVGYLNGGRIKRTYRDGSVRYYERRRR